MYDCPHSRSEIEKAFDKLENVARSMNEAADDPLIKSTLRKTWVLQERLRFPSKVSYELGPLGWLLLRVEREGIVAYLLYKHTGNERCLQEPRSLFRPHRTLWSPPCVLADRVVC